MVLLPREIPGEAAPEEALPARTLPSMEAGERTVLIVDDDEGIRKLLRFELEPYGIQVREAANGRAGLELARSEKPDAILLDILMPGLDGWETLRTLKETPETRSIPVLILSVVEDRAFALSVGAFDYLLKPLDRAALIETLERRESSRPGLRPRRDDDPTCARLRPGATAAGYRVRNAEGGARPSRSSNGSARRPCCST